MLVNQDISIGNLENVSLFDSICLNLQYSWDARYVY